MVENFDKFKNSIDVPKFFPPIAMILITDNLPKFNLAKILHYSYIYGYYGSCYTQTFVYSLYSYVYIV